MRIKQWLTIGVGLIVLIVIGLLIHRAISYPHLTGTTTVATFVVPSTLPTERALGSCWTTSIAAPARGDAWRCLDGNSISDPCFTITSSSVLCGVDPIKHTTGYVLKLTSFLPTSTPVIGATPHPWLLELHDGSVCTPFTGTLPFFGNDIAYYSCDTGHLTSMPAAGTPWTVKEFFMKKNGTDLDHAVSTTVTAVWE